MATSVCSILRKTFPAWMAASLIMIMVAGCRPSADIDTSVKDAEDTYANGNISRSQQICNGLMADDFDKLDENQLGRLAILFMKLSETENSDENVADATQCFRQAWKLSQDSLRGFIGSLPPEDLPHFVMLTRIGGSIDFPPDLSQDPYADDSLHIHIQP